MATKSSSKIHNLNAPKKTTWLISFLTGIAGTVTGIIGVAGGGAWAGVASLILLVVSAGLLLVSSYVKNL